jgi:hypothetical protein
MWNRRHRFIRRLAAGLAFAAVVVPTAQARVVEGTGIGSSARQEVVADFKGYGYYQGTPVGQQSTLVRPDDRSVRFTPEAGNPQIVAAPSEGFDWSDAGIGAGSALGIMLLALGAALATRSAGRKSLANA